jgi:hypothetical protein
MNIDLSTSALSIADAKTIVDQEFRRNNSQNNTPTAAYAAARANFTIAMEKWPALMMVATVLYVLDQQHTVDPAGLTAALVAFSTDNG